MNKLFQENGSIKLWLSLVMRMFFFAVALMWPAGIWWWWQAWVIVVIWSGFTATMVAYLLSNDPALLAERMKFVPLQKDQKFWDKVLMSLFIVVGIGLYIIPGFDVVRYEWSDPLPLPTMIIAMAIHLPCFFILSWVMRENTFLSQVVKIDEERQHEVITTGPYALVRHPMYFSVILLLFALPLALGSRFGLIPAVFLAVLLVVRTYLEDHTLQVELTGYIEYTKQTPYRLIPGIW